MGKLKARDCYLYRENYIKMDIKSVIQHIHWIILAEEVKQKVACYCEHSNEPSGSMKYTKSLD